MTCLNCLTGGRCHHPVIGCCMFNLKISNFVCIIVLADKTCCEEIRREKYDGGGGGFLREKFNNLKFAVCNWNGP